MGGLQSGQKIQETKLKGNIKREQLKCEMNEQSQRLSHHLFLILKKNNGQNDRKAPLHTKIKCGYE